MSDLADWVADALGHRPIDVYAFRRALTHSSRDGDSYQRLEFLGDRVLGLSMAEWLYETFPGEPEGALSKRLNALVTGPVCADIARSIGARDHLRLGKQARDDGAADSDNVLGDVMEALLGALYLDAGLDMARATVRRLWADKLHAGTAAPQHPKSALQEWAAANRRKPPVYELIERTGPGHAPRFRVKAAIPKLAEEVAEGTSKQEAETAAARALLAAVGATPMNKKPVRPEPVEARPTRATTPEPHP